MLPLRVLYGIIPTRGNFRCLCPGTHKGFVVRVNVRLGLGLFFQPRHEDRAFATGPPGSFALPWSFSEGERTYQVGEFRACKRCSDAGLVRFVYGTNGNSFRGGACGSSEKLPSNLLEASIEASNTSTECMEASSFTT